MGSAVRMSARSCDCVQMFREWIRARPSVERSISMPNSERPVSSHTEPRQKGERAPRDHEHVGILTPPLKSAHRA